jgi:hypothetical protein
MQFQAAAKSLPEYPQRLFIRLFFNVGRLSRERQRGAAEVVALQLRQELARPTGGCITNAEGRTIL